MSLQKVSLIGSIALTLSACGGSPSDDASTVGSELNVASLTSEGSDGSPRGLQNVKHVIVIMQENHSFDNYFGALAYAPGSPYHQARRNDDGDRGDGGCAAGDHGGGSSAGATASTGGGACTPDPTKPCSSCPPTNNIQFLNACSNSVCYPFDNTAKGVPNPLPPVQ